MTDRAAGDNLTGDSASQAKRESPTLHHLTLNTGHVAETRRSEVADEMIDLLRPMVRAGRGDFAGIKLGFLLSPLHVPGGSFLAIAERADLRADPMILGVANWREDSSVAAWNAATLLYETTAPLLRSVGLYRPSPECPRATRWLAVILTPALTRAGDVTWLGDLERCIFWTLEAENPHVD